MQADRNLLLGILAYQNAFVSKDALLAGMQAWLFDKSVPLAQVLQNQGVLDAERRNLLDALVLQHLKQHGDDAQRSLNALSSAGSVRQDLERLGDKDVHASLAHVPAGKEADTWATRSPWAGASTSAGTRFRILRPHARGGLGEVFVAVDQELNREVALKEIQSCHADHADNRARFLLEAEITGGLEHPSIVPVYGLGTYDDGRPFYAMRFIRGDSLKDAIDRFHGKRSTDFTDSTDSKRKDKDQSALKSVKSVDKSPLFDGLDFRKLLGRLIDVCQAIQYAHDRGVLHRDLKPGNIMLGKYGETLVVDWGLAKSGVRDQESGVRNQPGAPATGADAEPPLRPASASGSAETVAGTALGTPAFMSPEQAEGRLDLLGPASDVYSLGATLYCLLTGHPPVSGPVEEVLKKVRNGDIPPSRRLNPAIDPALDAVCLKAMSLRPQDRYATPKALADDVEKWLAGEPVSAWPEPWKVKVRRWVGRHRTLVSSAAAVLVVAAVGLTLLTVLLGAANEAERQARKQADVDRKQAIADRKQAIADRQRAEDKEKLAEAEKKLKEEQLRRSETLLYYSTFREAYRHFGNNDLIGVRAALDDCRRDLRGPEYGFLASYCRRRLRLVGAHENAVKTLALSADGKRLFSGSGERVKSGEIKVWDLEAGNETLTLRGHTGPVNSLALSADGKRLFSGSDDQTIKAWDLETGKETLTLRGHNSLVSSLALSANGKRLFSGSWDEIKVWDLEAGKETLTLRGHMPAIRSLALSADGKWLLSGSGDLVKSGEIKVWDLEAGKETLTLRGHTGAVWSLTLSADGKRLFSGSLDQTIKVWDLETGKETLTLRGHTDSVWSLALSADSKRLFSGSVDTIKVWDVEAGKETLTLRGHKNAVVWSLALSVDGKRLFSGSGDQTIKVWDLEAGKETLTLRAHAGPVNSLALSADGKRLFSGSWDQTIKVWDLETGKETLTLRGHTGAILSLALSADGKRLFSGSGDQAILVWDLEAGKETLTLRGHTGPVNSLALSADGKRLFSGSWDQTIKVWDLETGKETLTLRGHTGAIWSLALSADGKRLVSGEVGEAIKVWDLEAGKETLTLRGAGVVNSLALSADGKRLFSESGDQTIKVWDLETGKETLTLRGHTGEVRSLALSADGKRLFSGSGDKTIKVWDLEAGKETLTLGGHTHGISSLALSADGKRLFSGSGERVKSGEIKVWDLDAGEER